MTDRLMVSVCVVTYNHHKYIRQCLQSIVEQRADFEFEVLIGDDCSTDGARAIVQEFTTRFPQKVKAVLHKHKVGGTENYLSVHRLARGEFVCECDGDDYWLPGKLQAQARVMIDNPDVVQIWHRQQIVDENSTTVGVFPKRFPRAIYYKRLEFEDLAHSYGLIGQHSSQMYRKAARTVYERDRPTIDYFFALDIGTKGPSLYMPEILGCYRVVPRASITQAIGGRDIVDIAMIDAVHHFAMMRPTARAAFKANLWIRALGAMYKRRKHWRLLGASVRSYPLSVRSMIRSFVVFALSKT